MLSTDRDTVISSFPRYPYLIPDTSSVSLVSVLYAIGLSYINYINVIILRAVPSHPPFFTAIYHEEMLNFLKGSFLQL